MNPVVYLTLEEVITIHQDQIGRYGGSHGIRELSLLESAIFRSQSSFAGEELYPSVFGKAASLLHSLILNHPFLDGNEQSSSANKRTAMVSAIVFLSKNGFNLKVSQKALVKMALEVAEKKLDINTIANWLEENSLKQPQ